MDMNKNEYDLITYESKWVKVIQFLSKRGYRNLAKWVAINFPLMKYKKVK